MVVVAKVDVFGVLDVARPGREQKLDFFDRFWIS